MERFEIPKKIISGVSEVRTKAPFDTIVFKGIDGREKKAVHLSLEGEVKRNLKEEDEVQVRGKSGVFTINFGEYLARLGISHARYFQAMKTRPMDSPIQILRDLHQEVIAERSTAALRQHKKYTSERADRDNLQQETAKDQGPFFRQTINDLGIDGLEVREAPFRVDYLDGIDEIIQLDHKALETNGEEVASQPVKIGLQRSFSDKEEEIRRDRIRFIPEDPEAGLIFRVFILEKLEDYTDLAGETSLYQKLLDLRAKKAREQGLDPTTYARGKKNEGLPTVDKVLSGGINEQVARTLRVLSEIKKQLGSYIDSAKFIEQPKAVQVALRKQYEQIKIDDFIEAVEELATAA